MENPSFLFSVVVELAGYIGRPNASLDELCTNHALPELHTLCQEYDIKPVYYVSYQMLGQPDVRDFLRASVDSCEVGLYPLPHHTPPYVSFSGRNHFQMSEYDDDAIYQKIGSLASFLQDTTGITPQSIKLPRYDPVLWQKPWILEANGLVSDSSVRPEDGLSRYGELRDGVCYLPCSDFLGFETAISQEANRAFGRTVLDEASLSGATLRTLRRLTPILPYCTQEVITEAQEHGYPVVQLITSSADTARHEFYRSDSEYRMYLESLEGTFALLQDTNIISRTAMEILDSKIL
ncbi:MAG: hypothetical protein ACQESG_03380 [Nanobdellota archaeon]